jgi:hypothetical protein
LTVILISPVHYGAEAPPRPCDPPCSEKQAGVGPISQKPELVTMGLSYDGALDRTSFRQGGERSINSLVTRRNTFLSENYASFGRERKRRMRYREHYRRIPLRCLEIEIDGQKCSPICATLQLMPVNRKWCCIVPDDFERLGWLLLRPICDCRILAALRRERDATYR